MVKYVNNTGETNLNQLQHAFATPKMGTEPILSGVFALMQMQMLQKLLSGISLIGNNGTKWITPTNGPANAITIAQWKQTIRLHLFVSLLEIANYIIRKLVSDLRAKLQRGPITGEHDYHSPSDKHHRCCRNCLQC